MKIKDLPKSDRPREKLEKYGPALPVCSFTRRRERLSDSELLAILLGVKISHPDGLFSSNCRIKEKSLRRVKPAEGSSGGLPPRSSD